MDVARFSVPVLVVMLLGGCDSACTSKEQQDERRLVENSLSNMVVVEGGEFLMGDFGPLVGEHLPYTFNHDDKKLHKVILKDFKISKYKVTYEDYEIYRAITGGDKLVVGMSKRYPKIVEGNVSVAVTWQKAKNYCLWLAKKTGENVDLPSEGQWEYAARSRGQYFPFATDDGTFDEGRNVPSGEEKERMIGMPFPFYPIGLYPPNPLGLYDMGLSGVEWTNDWYAEDYYWRSPEVSPKGPESGVKKVGRGYDGGDPQLALTMYRQNLLPIPITRGLNYETHGINSSYVFRCAIN
ncbi:MAG: formylglycine-generating enzyme family protein [Pseudomonas sp.]